MESRRNGPQLSSRHDDDDDDGPGFESRVGPLFHWVATLGKLFTHIAYLVSALQETGSQKGVFGA